MVNFVKTSDLSERISFNQIKNVKNEFGEVEKQEVEIFSCWASVRTLMFKDIVASMGTVLEGTITFIIRYHQDYAIDNSMTLKWNGKKFSIVQITPGEFKKDFTTVIAKAVS